MVRDEGDRMTATSKGKLTVNTSPVPALVYVDDQLAGSSPYSAEISTGQHKVSYGEVSVRTPNSQTVNIVANRDNPVTGLYTVIQEQDVWKKIDKEFTKAMDHAEKAYLTNYVINLIIVAIGIIFLLSSLYFAYARGLDASTLTFAGLGIADFVALFLVNPQSRIQQLIGDLSQIVVISRNWKVQMTVAENYIWPPPSGDARDLKLEDIQKINAELKQTAEASLSAIEKYIGAKLTGTELTGTKPTGTVPTKKSSQSPQNPTS